MTAPIDKIRKAITLATNPAATAGERQSALHAIERLLRRLDAATDAAVLQDLRQSIADREQHIARLRQRNADLNARIERRQASVVPSASSVHARRMATLHLPRRSEIIDIRPAPGIVVVRAVGEKTITLHNLLDLAAGLPGQRWTRNQWFEACRKCTSFEVRRL